MHGNFQRKLQTDTNIDQNAGRSRLKKKQDSNQILKA